MITKREQEVQFISNTAGDKLPSQFLWRQAMGAVTLWQYLAQVPSQWQKKEKQIVIDKDSNWEEVNLMFSKKKIGLPL